MRDIVPVLFVIILFIILSVSNYWNMLIYMVYSMFFEGYIEDYILALIINFLLSIFLYFYVKKISDNW